MDAEVRGALEDKVVINDKKLGGSNLERGIFVSSRGEILQYLIGSENRIVWTNINPNFMKNGIICHSHPDGSPLSPADLIAFFNLELFEISAVTRNGVYRVIRTSKKISKEEGLKKAAAYRNFLGEDCKAAKYKYNLLSDEEKKKYKELALKKYPDTAIFLDDEVCVYEFIFNVLKKLYKEKLELIHEQR